MQERSASGTQRLHNMSRCSINSIRQETTGAQTQQHWPAEVNEVKTPGQIYRLEGKRTCDMTSQWSNTAWGKAWPDVAARSVEVNPKDSMTGRYAFRLKIGVPAHIKTSRSALPE